MTRAWAEELRWLDYGQRLQLRQRNVSAAPAEGQSSTAQRLWRRVQAGGAKAAGFATWGLVQGARADLLVLDAGHASLLGVAPAHTLDAFVFSSPGAAFGDVMVGGRWVLRDGLASDAAPTAQRFEQAMHTLWGSGG